MFSILIVSAGRCAAPPLGSRTPVSGATTPGSFFAVVVVTPGAVGDVEFAADVDVDAALELPPRVSANTAVAATTIATTTPTMIQVRALQPRTRSHSARITSS